jgi:hypothetical protein
MSSAPGASVLDQSFSQESWTITYSVGNEYDLDYVGQSFTAGFTGRLTEIRTKIRHAYYAPTSPPLRLSVFTFSNGQPEPFPAITVLLERTSSLISEPIIPVSPFEVTAGRQYLIAADYPNLPAGTHQTYGAWDGWMENLYPRGSTFEGRRTPNGAINWTTFNSSFDLYFQTYVEPKPVPEPAGCFLFAVVCIAFRFRRRAIGDGPEGNRPRFLMKSMAFKNRTSLGPAMRGFTRVLDRAVSPRAAHCVPDE